MAAKNILLGALGSAFVLGFIYMILLRFLGKPLIFLSIIAIILGMAYAGYMLYDIGSKMPEAHEHKQYYLVGSYVVWGITGLLVLCVCCNITNIRIGIAVMQCTA